VTSSEYLSTFVYTCLTGSYSIRLVKTEARVEQLSSRELPSNSSWFSHWWGQSCRKNTTPYDAQA